MHDPTDDINPPASGGDEAPRNVGPARAVLDGAVRGAARLAVVGVLLAVVGVLLAVVVKGLVQGCWG